jgi:hypothetical protein
MQFIIEKAIEGLLIDKSQAKALAEIISVTPNPEHAINLLFKNYTQPMFNMFKLNKDEKYEFLSYDEWNDRVHYKYERNKKKHFYIRKDTDESLITPENYKTFEVSWKDGETKSFNLILPEIETGTNSCSKTTWDDFKNDCERYAVDVDYDNEEL